MDAQDKIGSKIADSIPMSGSRELEVEHVPKVRKRYTITKQRERWTEEEHTKFLEAIQMHGRAWRRIEEHIGTKTSVQIRSHAQKFFSKVLREPVSSGAGSPKVIEIPPPRPKKKPVHPYPRNVGNSTVKVISAPVRPSMSKALASEHEHTSPTSVLSEIMSSAVSNPPDSCTSPATAAAVGSDVPENGGQSLTVSVEEENGPSSQDPVSGLMATQEESTMGLDLAPDDAIPMKQTAQAPTIKLFGRTVLVTDSQKPLSTIVGLPAVVVQSHNRSIDTDCPSPDKTTVRNAVHGDQIGLPTKSSWNPWAGAVPSLFYCLPFHREPANPTGPAFVSLPWWNPYQLSFPSIYSQNFSSKQVQLQSCTEYSNEEEVQNEGSGTGSNTASLSGGGNADQHCDAVDLGEENNMDERPASTILRPRPGESVVEFSSRKRCSDDSRRGFVPYRRCAAEREVQSSQMSHGEEEGQMVRLC